jgi:hypothetical protein
MNADRAGGGGGAWMLSKVALMMFRDGDGKALRAYYAADRTGDLVVAYSRRVMMDATRVTPGPDVSPLLH